MLKINNILIGALASIIFVGCSNTTPSTPTVAKKVKYVSNQQYICTKVEAKIEQKLFNKTTTFYVDDNNILHTDDKTNNQLKSFIKSVYKNSFSAIRLEAKDKLYMKRKLVKGNTRGIMDTYICQEKN